LRGRLLLALRAQLLLRRERQLEGIAKAKAAGVYKGRPASIDAAQGARIEKAGASGPPRSPRPSASAGRASIGRWAAIPLAGIITDYRAGEIPPVPRPSKEHVKGWVEQFDENIRDKILTELAHVLALTYIAKPKVEGFLSALVTNEQLTGSDAKSFWQGAKLLDIQKKGNSQREMLSMFAVPLKDSLGLELGDCGDTIFAPQFKAFLKDACAVGRRRPDLADSTIDRSASAPP
jgi:hypothetical protein